MKRIVFLITIIVLLSGCSENPIYTTTCTLSDYHPTSEQVVFIYKQDKLLEYYIDGESIELTDDMDYEYAMITIESHEAYGAVCLTEEE